MSHQSTLRALAVSQDSTVEHGADLPVLRGYRLQDLQDLLVVRIAAAGARFIAARNVRALTA